MISINDDISSASASAIDGGVSAGGASAGDTNTICASDRDASGEFVSATSLVASLSNSVSN